MIDIVEQPLPTRRTRSSSTLPAMPTVHLSRTRYRLTPPTDAPVWVDLVSHATRNGSLADFAIRRDVVRRISHRDRTPVVLFEHPVRGDRIAGWVAPLPHGLTLYRERRLSTGLVSDEWTGPAAAWLPAQRFGAASARILDALAARIRDRPVRHAVSRPAGRARTARRLASTIQAIEAAVEPAAVRSVWRALSRFAILDARCGTGDRILEAAIALTVVALACVERMSAWVDALDDGPIPARRTRLADFRRVLDRHPSDGREGSLFREIAIGCIHAADPRREAILAARARMTNLCGPHAAPMVENKIRDGDACLGISSYADLAGSIRTDGEGERLLERVELLNRAATLGPGRPATEGTAMLEARRSEIRHGLDRHAAERAIGGGSSARTGSWLARHRPLHPIVEWPLVATRGGFDVILGEPRTRPDGLAAGGYRELRTRVSAVRERSHMRDGREYPAVRRLDASCADYPRALAVAGGNAQLWVRGDPRLLELPSIALFASERVAPDLALRTLEAVPLLRSAVPCVLGGFQSPLEKACLRSLLPGPCSLAIFPARRIEPFRSPPDWHGALVDGRILLVSVFGPEIRRATSKTASDRNRVVTHLAGCSFVAHATPGGRLATMVRSVLSNGGRVATWADRANADLVRAGAVAVADADALIDHIRQVDG
jgi:hypothetical protein